MADLRLSPRHLTLKGAHIVFNDGRSTISCVVKNLSVSGALLQVQAVFGIPSSFRLALSDGTQRPCWVVRRAAKEIGVAFTDWQPDAEAIGQ